MNSKQSLCCWHVHALHPQQLAVTSPAHRSCVPDLIQLKLRAGELLTQPALAINLGSHGSQPDVVHLCGGPQVGHAHKGAPDQAAPEVQAEAGPQASCMHNMAGAAAAAATSQPIDVSASFTADAEALSAHTEVGCAGVHDANSTAHEALLLAE